MNKITFATIIACFVFTAAFSQEKNGLSYSRSSDGKATKSVIESDNNGLHFKVEYTGDITLNESETAIESIAEGGMLKYEKNGSRLVAQSKDGVISYELYEDGAQLSQSSEKGQQFIARVMKELIAFGFDAERHVARVYKRGGTNAVLAEVSGLQNDYVKQVYLGELLKTGNLNATEMIALAKSVAALGGSYEKGQVLQKYAGAYLKNPETVQAYFDAAGTIKGDYEKGQVLKAALKEQLSKTAISQLLAVAAPMGGDYEKGQVLQAALKEPMAKTNIGQLLAATATMRGDYEKGQVLQAALKQPLDKAALGEVLAAAATISGDYEKAQVLKKVASTNGLDEENCNKLLNDAGGMQSAYEKAGVLAAVITSDSLSNASFNLLVQVTGRMDGAYEKSGVFKALAAKAAWATDEWVSLINAAASVNTAYEKSSVLITIAGKMPTDAKVRTAYMETAKTIGSSYEYDQAVKAAK